MGLDVCDLGLEDGGLVWCACLQLYEQALEPRGGEEVDQANGEPVHEQRLARVALDELALQPDVGQLRGQDRVDGLRNARGRAVEHQRRRDVRGGSGGDHGGLVLDEHRLPGVVVERYRVHQLGDVGGQVLDGAPVRPEVDRPRLLHGQNAVRESILQFRQCGGSSSFNKYNAASI